MFVRAPVATIQGTPFGQARRASRMAMMAGGVVMGGMMAAGRRSVPSRPETPGWC